MDDRYAIQCAKTEIRDGFSAGDTERILAHYAPGYTDLCQGFPSTAREEAHDVLRARLTLLFAAYYVKLAPVTIDITVLGTSALAMGWYLMTCSPRAGGPCRVHRTRYLELWEKTDAGWKLALLFNNEDIPPALGSEIVERLQTGRLDPLRGELSRGED